jgi:hypothetical protein
MAIDKALYEAPVGLAALNEPPIEVEIEDPESVSIEMDGIEVEIEPRGKERTGIKEFSANLAEHLEESALQELAEELIGHFDDDKRSRKDWEKTYKTGLDLLGLKIENRTEPWPGACGVFHPILTEATVRFQSEAIMETFPPRGPVKAKILGKEDMLAEKAAERVKDYMNYVLTEKMVNYRTEHERMLWSLPLTGAAFKKVYYDPTIKRPEAIFIPAEDFVAPFSASDLESCERFTHVMRKVKNEIRKMQVSGFYRDVDLEDPPDVVTDDVKKAEADAQGIDIIKDDRYTLLEMNVNLDLENDPYRAEGEIEIPYVVTVDYNSGQVLSIYRNWSEDDETYKRRMHYVKYDYVPGFGFYGYGLIHLIGGHAKSATSLLRQLIDAGTLANLPGGLKTRGMRIKGDETPIMPGEFRDVDVPSGKIQENITFLPYKEPSQTLLSLFDKIVEQGRGMAAVADLKIGDVDQNTPVGTTLAVLERMLKIMSAVQARMHATLKKEFGLLKAIIEVIPPAGYEYNVDPDRMIKESDFERVDIIPVSDPNASTFSQRMLQYQAALQLSQQRPELYDLPELHRGMIRLIGFENADKIVPKKDEIPYRDPVSENAMVLQGKPVKAFPEQDHEAHLTVHTNAMKDPKLRALIGQSPNAQVISGAMEAHIAEHLGYAYRNEIQQSLGIDIPPLGAKMDPLMENQLSRLMADASQKVLQQSQAEVAQKEAMAQAQDPLTQLQREELQIKAAEVDRKLKKDMSDAALRSAEIALKQEEIENKKEEQDKKLASEETLEGFRAAINLRKGPSQRG